MRGNARGAGLDSRAAKTGKAGAGGDSWHGLKPRECAGMRGSMAEAWRKQQEGAAVAGTAGTEVQGGGRQKRQSLAGINEKCGAVEKQLVLEAR